MGQKVVSPSLPTQRNMSGDTPNAEATDATSDDPGSKNMNITMNNSSTPNRPIGASPANEYEQQEDRPAVSNEYVLNVAFLSFLIFMALEAVFAIIAGSASMLEDAEAMGVDALTYLFNLCAERIKNRPYSVKELQMDPKLRDYRREKLRLYLEFIPPFISVVTLVIVTITATRNAMQALRQASDDDDEEVDVWLMFSFSFLNLILDIVNVFCFARANQAFGFSVALRPDTQTAYTRYSIPHVKRPRSASTASAASRNVNTIPIGSHDTIHEDQPLLARATDGANANGNTISANQRLGVISYSSTSVIPDETFDNEFDDNADTTSDTDSDDTAADDDEVQNALLVNLNMCSAWTHVCADTLRSIAVLIAASIAFVVPGVSGTSADSVAAIVVSVIILISLIPLLRGLFLTAQKLLILRRQHPLHRRHARRSHRGAAKAGDDAVTTAMR